MVEPPELPLPGAPGDPRRRALAAAIEELERLGVPTTRQTILVAGGLNRRAGHRGLEALLPPSFARQFHGRVDGARRRVARPRPRRRRGTDTIARQPAPARHRSDPLRHGRRDGAARRRRCAARSVRARDAARCDRPLAARDRGLTRLAARRRPRASAGCPCARARNVARAEPAATHRPLSRLPVRGRLARARRPLAAPPPLAAAGGGPTPTPAGSRPRTDCRRRLRRPAVGCARRGTSSRDRQALDAARGTARRDRDRHALEAPARAARASEPDHRRDGRARARAPALARRLPDQERRHRDRSPPALTPFRAWHPGSVPHPLPLAPRRAHGGGPRRRRARGGDRHARARRLPRRPRLPSAPSLRRLGQLPARARTPRRRRRRRLPRPPGSADARLRADPRGLERARDGARPCRRRGPDRLSARPALLSARGRRRPRSTRYWKSRSSASVGA